MDGNTSLPSVWSPDTLVAQSVHDVAHRLGRSAWRRRHQARAQAGQYRRQAANQT